MEHLADAVLDYLWFINFTDEEEADPDLTVKLLESLSHAIEHSFTAAEKQALRDAASRRLESWLREPDEYGYTPRRLLTDDQREFLQDISAGRFT